MTATAELTQATTLAERIRMAVIFGSPMEALLAEVQELDDSAGASNFNDMLKDVGTYRAAFIKMASAVEPFRQLASFLATKEEAGHYTEPLMDHHTVITLRGGGGSVSVTVGDLRKLIKVVKDTKTILEEG